MTDPGGSAYRPYLPDVACDPRLAGGGGVVTRDAVTMFLDVAGFTGLSERLARHGTAGTEQMGEVIRRVIGGALDAAGAQGGDALAFGGDAVLVAFEGAGAPRRARDAADAALAAVAGVSGTATVAGPVQISARAGIAGGRVTSLACEARSRTVVVHLGPGLDAAVQAEAAAAPGTVAVHDPPDGGTGRTDGQVPEWAFRLLHPVTASRVAEGLRLPDEHRRLTAAFIALPPVDDRDPVATAALAALVVEAADVVAEAGGDLVQCTGGDKGIVAIAVFGAPVAHPDDAARAVHAVERIRAVNPRLAAGVATGLAFTGVFGGRSRRFASVLGDPMNVAARLMAEHAAGTLVDGATAAELGETVRVAKVRSTRVRGRDQAVTVQEVVGLAAVREPAGEGATPLVGRRSELDAAEALLDALAAGAGGALAVVGEAGSGKTRIAAEVVRRARVRGIAVRTAAFEAFGLGPPLGPFAALLEVRIDDAAALAAALQRVRPEGAELAPLVAHLLGLAAEETGLTAALTAEERAELAGPLMLDLLCDVSQPGLLVIEDAHWADEASGLLLAQLGPRLPGERIALVTTRRPAGTPPAPGASILLGELPAAELATVVRDTWTRLGGGPLPPEYVATLAERAAGSPLFAETVTEVVRGAYRPGNPLPEPPLPDSLLPFVTARLDELGDAAQLTALRAAVLGRPASAAGLAAVFGADERSLAADLDVLVAAGLARGGDGGVWLRHATLAETLLLRASHADRAPLHERVCHHLIAAGASAREVARHLEHGRLPDLEHRWYGRARAEAWSTWALREARHWAELALAAGAVDTADVLALAELEQQLGDHEPAERRLRELAGTGADGARKEALLGRIAYETGRPGEAVEHLMRAEDAGAAGAFVSWPLTMALCDLGRFAEARDRSAAQLARGRDDPRLRLDALANLSVVAAREGDLAEAGAAAEEARVLAAELGDESRLVHVTGDLAGIRFMAGRVPEAAALLDEATALAHRLGARRVVAMTLGNLALVRLAAGDRDGAERAALASADAALERGDAGMALDCLQVPAAVAELRGETALAAGRWLRHALIEERLGRPYDAALSWYRHAAAQAAEGDAAGAASAVARAADLSGDVMTDDLELQRSRAADARPGMLPTPSEAVTVPIELPPLDAGLPAATAARIDAVFAQVEALVPPAGDRA